MTISVSIAPDDLKWLENLPGNFKRDLYKGVSEAVLFAEGEAKKSFGQSGHLKVKTGTLRRSIKSTSNKAEGSLSSNVVYAAIHEFGGTIKAKSSGYLKFKIGGNWKTVKQVVMPKRAYLMPAFADNMDEINEMITNIILKGMSDE